MPLEGRLLKGTTLTTDEETGFLTPTFAYSIHGFTSERKQDFIRQISKYWPHMSKLCKHVGIHIQTFRSHCLKDKHFKEAVDYAMTEAQESGCDDLEVSMFSRAKTPGGFMDRIAMLRAYRPGKFSDNRRVEIDIGSNAKELLMSRFKDHMEAGKVDRDKVEVIDVKPVSNPKES